MFVRQQPAARDCRPVTDLDGLAIEKGAAAAAGAETFPGGGVEHHARHRARAFDHRRTDGEVRPALHEGDRAVDGIDHEDLGSAQPRRIVTAFLRQPAIIGPGPAQFILQEGVDRQIRFSDGASAAFVPAFVLAAKIFQRDLAGLAHASFEKCQIAFIFGIAIARLIYF